MKIKEGMADEYARWVKKMTIDRAEVVAFFNLFCAYSERGMDPIVFISNVLMIHSENDRPFCVDFDEICLAMRAFSKFHTQGDSFRCRWNAAEMNINYANYIEEIKSKYVISPFADLSIFLKFYKDDDKPDNPENTDGWRRE